MPRYRARAEFLFEAIDDVQAVERYRSIMRAASKELRQQDDQLECVLQRLPLRSPAVGLRTDIFTPLGPLPLTL
jgi:hypothetical protein